MEQKKSLENTECPARAGAIARPRFALQALLCLIILLTWSTAGSAAEPSDPDPFENLNRRTFSFNQDFDRVVLRPAAQAYCRSLPGFLKTGIGNVLRNFRDVNNTFNSAFQGRVRDTGVGLLRLGLNTTLGLGGAFDVAGGLGIEPAFADFGQTLKTWNVPAGPYLVLPIVGPSTVRDGIGFGIDAMALSVPSRMESLGTRAAIWATAFTHTRSQLLGMDAVEVGDLYLLYRDIYFQQRASMIGDDDLGDDDGFDPGDDFLDAPLAGDN